MLADSGVTWESVEELFQAQIGVERLHPGAALAVYQGGRLVVDLVAGLADTQRGVAVSSTTLFALRSAGKPFASVAILQLIERGRLELDAPVATYWPRFARHGKGAVTVRHVLTHRGGFADGLGHLEPDRWLDEEAVAAALEELSLRFPPGTASSYYHLAQQWVCAELVRRVDGRSFPTYLREEITNPLEMNNTHVGLPAELEARVAPTHLTEAVSREDFGAVRFNRRGVHRLPAPVFGVSTAPDLARFYAALAAGGEMNGVRVLGAETVAGALAVAVDGEWDHALEGPVRRGLGFSLSGLHEPAARTPGTDSNERTFYHEGAGTVLAWGDLDLQLTMAFLTNGFRPARYVLQSGAPGRTTVTVAPDDTGARRDRALSDAVRAAAAGPG
jgi:CubicO group peptidase (beta-lactamase class C family)